MRGVWSPLIGGIGPPVTQSNPFLACNYAAQACIKPAPCPSRWHLAIRDLHNGDSQLTLPVDTCTSGKCVAVVLSTCWDSMYVALSWHSKTAHDPAR